MTYQWKTKVKQAIHKDQLSEAAARKVAEEAIAAFERQEGTSLKRSRDLIHQRWLIFVETERDLVGISGKVLEHSANGLFPHLVTTFISLVSAFWGFQCRLFALLPPFNPSY